jgi:hypothetical protein
MLRQISSANSVPIYTSEHIVIFRRRFLYTISLYAPLSSFQKTFPMSRSGRKSKQMKRNVAANLGPATYGLCYCSLVPQSKMLRQCLKTGHDCNSPLTINFHLTLFNLQLKTSLNEPKINQSKQRKNTVSLFSNRLPTAISMCLFLSINDMKIWNDS